MKISFSFGDTQKYKSWTRELKEVRVELGLDMSQEQKLLIAIGTHIGSSLIAALKFKKHANQVLSQFEAIAAK